MEPLLRVTNLSVRYDQRTILDGLDLELSESQTVALQGPSGSGKSSLFNCIAAIQVPDNGEIFLENKAYSSMSDRDRTLLRRRQIASIFQFFHLLPTMTASENIAFAAHVAGLDKSTIRHSVDQLLEEVKLKHRKDALPSELSGGEQQRVAIARALINKPRIILADEPTGNLDQKTSAVIIDLLLDECTRHGITLLLATHDQSVAAACQRQIYLSDGRLLQQV